VGCWATFAVLPDLDSNLHVYFAPLSNLVSTFLLVTAAEPLTTKFHTLEFTTPPKAVKEPIHESEKRWSVGELNPAVAPSHFVHKVLNGRRKKKVAPEIIWRLCHAHCTGKTNPNR
jgi:hypothetical protein